MCPSLPKLQDIFNTFLLHILSIIITLIRETHYPNLWRIPHKDWG